MSNSLVQRLLKSLKKSIKVAAPDVDVVDWPVVDITRHVETTVLVYDLPAGIDSAEFEVSHNLRSILLRIRPLCHDYLIPNIDAFSRKNPEQVNDRSRFAHKHQELRWSTCTADELSGFFSDWLLEVLSPLTGQPWHARSLMMVKPLIYAAIRMRDAGVCTLTAAWFKAHMQLDVYLTLIDNEFVDQAELLSYLSDLPCTHASEIKEHRISPTCVECRKLHEFQSMLVLWSFMDEKASGCDCMVRRPDRDVIYHSPIKKIVWAEAVKVGSRLEISVKHPRLYPKEFAPIGIKL